MKTFVIKAKTLMSNIDIEIKEKELTEKFGCKVVILDSRFNDYTIIDNNKHMFDTKMWREILDKSKDDAEIMKRIDTDCGRIVRALGLNKPKYSQYHGDTVANISKAYNIPDDVLRVMDDEAYERYLAFNGLSNSVLTGDFFASAIGKSKDSIEKIIREAIKEQFLDKE